MPGVVQTIRDHCKRCYNCVRHCPARAIRVVEGQAVVVEERCIACGNCFRVCAQHAKEIEDGVTAVRGFFESGGEVVAALAPSFPAAFQPARPGQLVSALRRLGFTRVVEVAFGADIVARRYAGLLAQPGNGPLLSTPCPALVTYIVKYAPELIPLLVPIVSPMIALGRAIKQKHWPQAKVVFVGPCTAKKNEVRDPEVVGAVDAVLTFAELQDMLAEAGIEVTDEQDSAPDPPRAALGKVFAVSGGLLRAAAIGHDVLESDIIITDGMNRVQRIVDEIREGQIRVRFADLLFCEGCINGPVMPATVGQFGRQELVTSHVRDEPLPSPEEVEAFLAQYDDVDLTRHFHDERVEALMPSEEEIRAVLARVNKFTPEDELNCSACGYNTCREKAIAVCQGLAEVEMCLPYLVDETQKALQSLAASHAALASTQERLIQAEKLATMGELAAGVAHQINNPLGSILLYGHLMMRQLPATDAKRGDMEVIVGEAARCKRIVADLLAFARENRLDVRHFDLNELLDGIISRAETAVGDGIVLVREFAADLPQIVADPEQITQVFTALVENACEAMDRGGTLTVKTRLRDEKTVEVRIADTGRGISDEAMLHIFEPFFTTKPMGQGTGLGLAIAAGIIRRHQGDVVAASRPEGGAEFTVGLPIAGQVDSPAVGGIE